ncbi:alpha/beta hydrolase [Thetidibacter halocola]|uniref:Alpha/beta hydrolase n=1 Tax=Thetidibacter halocola TaxID=2827239 RepID=A0A8J8B8L4_9RHOB|nr:alpha/beta hydrolase [Thetidibacter halocola]MBS0126346.1 alpha/beta hydrolase [Thetidibacter halocola]
MSYAFAETPGAGPLVFTFHGTGADETQFHGFARQILPEAHVISPRGDVSEMGALRYFRRRAEGVYDMDDLAQRTEAMADFLRAEKARVGARRTLAFGYSNGANILASVGFAHPGIVEAMALMHPLIPWQPQPQPGLSGRSVLITAGERDPICPAPLNRALEGWFADQGAEVTSHWHRGGHEITQDEVQATARFLQAQGA